MKRSIQHIALTVALCAPLLAGAAFAQKFERKVEKRFETQANVSVRIDGKFGPVTVTGSDQNVVDVKVLIVAEEDSYEEAKERAEDVEVTLEGSPGSVRVATDFSGNRGGGGRHSLDARITVSVPKSALLEIRNKFGSSKAMGVEGSITVQNEFGSVEVTNCANVRLVNAFGSTTANAIRGTLTIESKNGKVRAYDVPACRIRNAFGEIDLSDAHGQVEIHGQMGAIKARGIPGGNIANSYGSVVVSLDKAFSGTIEAKTKFGSVDSDFPLEPRVKNSEKQYGPVPEDLIGRIGNGSGRLRVINEFGEITIRKK